MNDEQKRITLEIEGSPQVVDTLVTLLRYIEACGRFGTTRHVALLVDGDGGAQLGLTVDGVAMPLDDPEMLYLFEGQGDGTPALRRQPVEARIGPDGHSLAVDLV